MRILITSIPGYGHLCPLIPLALAIRDAGHQVIIATSASCSDLLSKAGLQVLAAGPVWSESEFDHEMDLPHDDSGESRLLHFLNNTVYPQMLRDVQRHVRDWQPDIILSNDYDAVGRTVAESQSILFASVTHSARVGLSMRRELQGRLSAGVRQLCELPLVDELDYPFRWLHLNFAPPGYSIDGENYIEAANEHSLRPEIYDNFADWSTAKQSPATRGADKRPLLLCTLGTVYNKNPHFLQVLIRACSDQPYRVIITLGPAVAADALGGLPDNIEVHSFLPLSRIVPEVDFCICHGGAATLLTIMLHGKPVLVIPQGADQLFNAVGCAQLGIGISLNSDIHRAGVDTLDNAARSLREQIAQLLAGADYAANCRRLQLAMDRLPDMRYAVALLEKLHLTGAPVTKAV